MCMSGGMVAYNLRSLRSFMKKKKTKKDPEQKLCRVWVLFRPRCDFLSKAVRLPLIGNR